MIPPAHAADPSPKSPKANTLSNVLHTIHWSLWLTHCLITNAWVTQPERPTGAKDEVKRPEVPPAISRSIFCILDGIPSVNLAKFFLFTSMWKKGAGWRSIFTILPNSDYNCGYGHSNNVSLKEECSTELDVKIIDNMKICDFSIFWLAEKALCSWPEVRCLEGNSSRLCWEEPVDSPSLLAIRIMASTIVDKCK